MQYTGVQIDIRLSRTLPQQVAHWLSLHSQGKGNFKPINDFMMVGSPEFRNWEGGHFRLIEDHPEYGTHWHLKTAGSCQDLSMEHLSFFLHEIQPWSIMKENEVICRVVGEDQTSYEKIWYHDRADTLVVMQNGNRYPLDASHPRNWEVWDLLKGLGFKDDYPDNGGWRKWYYPTNAVVSPKQEEKRILARVHNENREAEKLAEIQKQIDALEGK
uniref:Uncharacterized protein n=1 Tax=Pseudomonas phage RVTF4 TaxID=3236931 RepID=A0AB39CCK2_9VIRU